MGTPVKPNLPKFCKTCGEPLVRKRYGKNMEDYTRYQARTHCNQSCANTKTQVTKDALHWRARKHRKPNCETCQTANDLHVHHVDRNPANNDPANLLTLCSSCHLKLHWREDREKRMAGVAKGQATAVARGVNTRPRSTDGKFSKAV